MSDRIKGLVVTFDKDLPIGEAEEIVNAILLLSHVASVEPSTWNNEDLMNRSRIRKELEQKLWTAFRSQA